MARRQKTERMYCRAGVMSQPNADSQVLGSKKEHDFVEVYSIVNGWACIKYESGTGFVDQYCIKSLDEASEEEQQRKQVNKQREDNGEYYLLSQDESDYIPTWNGATHYTKSMIKGEGASYYRGLYYIIISHERRTVAVVQPKKGKYKESSYVIPSSVSIGNETYTVTEIAPSAFIKSSNLREVVFPETLEAINSFAFSFCKELSHVKLPSKLKFVGDRAFFMDNITEIILPNSIEELADKAFLLCKRRTVVGHTQMGRLYIPNSIRKIGKAAFCGARKGYEAKWTAKFDIQNLPDWVSMDMAKEIGIHEDSYSEYARRKR